MFNKCIGRRNKCFLARLVAGYLFAPVLGNIGFDCADGSVGMSSDLERRI
jgi:hypothetical protein